MSKKPPAGAPYAPAEYNEKITMAVKALAAGNANEGQQKLSLEWILKIVCRTHDLSYRDGESGDRNTVFAEGKRFVGLQIVKQINLQMQERKTQ